MGRQRQLTVYDNTEVASGVRDGDSSAEQQDVVAVNPVYKLITEDGECTTEFRARLNRRQAIGASLQKTGHNIPISTKIRLMIALVWPVSTYGCESWTLRKNEETRLDVFEMKDLEGCCGFRGQQRKQMSGFLTKLE